MNKPSPTSEQTAERVQEHFQSAASSFDSLYQREHDESRLQRALRPGLFVRADAAVELVESFDSPRVLDVGCGSGRVGERMLDAGAAEYVGIDFSAPMIDLATKRLSRFGPKVKLVSGDFLGGELEGPFDVVTALGFFDYLPEPQLFTRRMAELCSGTAIASFPKWTPVKGPLRKVRYEWINKCPIFNYTEPQLQKLFADSGFGRVEIERKHAGFLARAHP
jgi:2-polyprenyl-3-methyl-5-hydroxy-6-metoxy-1,4-benzoquinol methylase